MDFTYLESLIINKEYATFRKEIIKYPPADIAEFINITQDKYTLLIFRLLPKEIAADVYTYLDIEKQSNITMLVNENELKIILDDLYFDDKVDLLEEMPANVVKRILKHTSDVERKLINQFLKYPDFSAGSLMTIEFVDLKRHMTVKEAIRHIRAIGLDKETIYTCYITNEKRHLEGIVSLKDLVLSSSDKRVEEIMRTEPLHVNTYDDQEVVANMFKKYDLLAIPVVDNENRLVGIITIDDIVDVIEEETTEDIYKMAAVIPPDEEYITASVMSLAKKRIPWLLALMISATFTGMIIKGYENLLAVYVVLTAYIPMLMNTGGNAGAQASTLVIRSLVLEEITFSDIFKVIWKEMRVSLVVGVILAGVNFLRIYFIEKLQIEIALTISLTLVITIMAAKMLGGILPIIAKKLKLDPTIMASPIITTIVDALALTIYFLFATWLLGLA